MGSLNVRPWRRPWYKNIRSLLFPLWAAAPKWPMNHDFTWGKISPSPSPPFSAPSLKAPMPAWRPKSKAYELWFWLKPWGPTHSPNLLHTNLGPSGAADYLTLLQSFNLSSTFSFFHTHAYTHKHARNYTKYAHAQGHTLIYTKHTDVHRHTHQHP